MQLATKLEQKWKCLAFNKIICEASLKHIERTYKADMERNDVDFVYEVKA